MGRILSSHPFHSSDTVRHRGRDCMVARMRHLAEQGRVCHRAATRQSHCWCVRPHEPRTRAVVAPGRLIVLAVFGFIGYHEPQIIPTTRVALLDTDNAFVKAAAIASLVTNALATALIAYKAWCVF